MHREHNILVRKHLNVSFPDTVKLLKVSGMMYYLIFYLFQLLYLSFLQKIWHHWGGGKYVENSLALFPEMLYSL